MIAVDTNVLVRIFIDDTNVSQVKKSRDLAKKAKHVYLVTTVIVEMVWVLDRAFKLNKSQIIAILQEVYENSAFILENEAIFLQALLLFKENNADFSDCIIFNSAQIANVKEIYTFDEKFARITGVKRL